MALRFLARANPPPIFISLSRPSDLAIDEISKHNYTQAYPEELNDPFECRAPVIWNVDLLRRKWVEGFALLHGVSTMMPKSNLNHPSNGGWRNCLKGEGQRWHKTGHRMFLAIPNSIRMWAYYAQAHQGICIGYDTKVRPFNIALEVKYKNRELRLMLLPPQKRSDREFAANITFRKSEEWEFEKEYRIASNLGDIRQIPFHPSAIKEIRFGARIKNRVQRKSDGCGFSSASSSNPHSNGM